MKQLIGIALVLSLFACNKSEPNINSIEEKGQAVDKIEPIQTKFSFEYGSPIVIESSDQVMIPLSANSPAKRRKLSGSSYSSYDFPRYWNVVFYDGKTGSTRLLTEKKVRISNIHVNKAEEYILLDDDTNQEMSQVILYEIEDIDFNGDGTLTSKDPTYLFSSSTGGTNLQRISPHNEHVQYFEVVPNSDQLLLRTIRDSNRDSIFTEKDISIWYKAELANQQWKLDEIIDVSNRQKIEDLFLNQWFKQD
ncbi:MAG: hypothetical protein AAGI38_12855 [Bacteroidota bacterium]